MKPTCLNWMDDEDIDEEFMEEIAWDTWHALNGIDTCEGGPLPELSAVLRRKAGAP